MSHNKGKTLKNKMMYSKVLLGVSLVAFSVAIPVVQNKINSIRETRHNYELNVLIAQSQNDESIFYSEMLNTLTILNQKILPHSKNFNEALDEIRNRFYQRAVNAYAHSIFLLTEDVEIDTLQSERLKNLSNKSLEELNALNKQISTHVYEYTDRFYKRIKFLENVKLVLYALATLTYIIGIGISIFTEKDSSGNR